MAAVVAIFRIALVGLVAWMTARALLTGQVALNGRVVRRRGNPVGYWLGIAVGCFLIYLWGGPLIREVWK